jgi:RimJ/RimL family protein N-acetyltransferase
MKTSIVAASDSDFEWMLQGTESIDHGLGLPLGGIGERLTLEHVRAMAAKLREQKCDGTWMIVSSGEVVGLCGYHQPPSTEGEVEIGYNVAPSRQRRGHATRAVAAIVAIAKDDPAVKTVLASTPVDNIASQRVLERNGFARVGEREDPEDGQLILWRINTTEDPQGHGNLSAAKCDIDGHRTE